jgi:hypothetical protein
MHAAEVMSDSASHVFTNSGQSKTTQFINDVSQQKKKKFGGKH